MSHDRAAPSRVPDDDLAWCHDTVQDVSRTFAISIDVLEEPVSSYVCVGYLLCRVADTVEDETSIPAAEKAAALRAYDRVLDPDDDADVSVFEEAVEGLAPPDTSDDWAAVADADRVLRTYRQFPPEVREALTPPIRELVGGMVTFVERHADRDGIRIQTLAELEEYCYYVAGTVGHLITNLHARTGDDVPRDRLADDAEAFGMLLQLVNISKDVHADYVEEDNVYLPAEWLADAGVETDDLLAGDGERPVGAVERTVEHARNHLDGARRYLETLSGVDETVVEAWTIPFLLAVGTLRELTERPEDALSPAGVKLSREDVLAIVTTVRGEDRPPVSSLERAVWRDELG